MRVCVTRGTLVGLVVLIAACLVAPSASAEESPPRVFKGSLGAGHLSLIGQSNLVDERGQSGVAVDQESGDVYVSDTGHGRIARYSAPGGSESTVASFTEPTFLAVDNSPGGSGNLYVVSNGRERITKLNSAGAPVSGWGAGGSMEGLGKIDGIAVDSTGNLFVLVGSSEAELHELGPGGTQSSQCLVPNTSGRLEAAPNGIALDTEGHLYFLQSTKLVPTLAPFLEGVVKITTACAPVPHGSEFARRAGFAGVAVDESDQSVFLGTNGDNVEHWASNGEEEVGNFGSGEGALEHSTQLAVGNANEAVYVGDPLKQYVAIFEPEAVEPPTVTLDPPDEVTTTTAHFTAGINPNDNPVTYRFECRPSCNQGPGLGSQSLPASSTSETVEATAEQLRPGTDYEVWIRATNAGGCTRAPGKGGAAEEPCSSPESEEGLPFTTGSVAPTIEEEAATEVSETAATVTASINPGGEETEYWVQYVTRAQVEASGFAGARETPVAALTPGSEGTPVSVALTELAPSTSYVFRFVARNVVEVTRGDPIPFTTREPSLLPSTGGCPNEIFRTEWSAMLPDCRAYEQSTPVDKNGGGVGAVPGAVQATEGPAGEGAVTYYTQAGIPGGIGAQDYPTFISSRGEGTWSTQGLLPPQSFGRKAVYLGLAPGGRFALSAALGTDANGENLGAGLFRRDVGSGALRTIVPYDLECPSISAQCFVFAGGTVDGSRIFFESDLPLTGETPVDQWNVFAWEEASGEVSLVDVDEAGAPLPEGGYAGPYAWPQENLTQGGSHDNFYVSGVNAVSAGRGQVIFTEAEEEEGSGEGHGQLYVRKGLGGLSPTSVKISAYREGRSGGELPAAFLEATAPGRYVFFKTKMALTGDSYAGEAGHESESLYRYDVATNVLVDLTPDPTEEHEDGPGVEGMLGSSESGRVAYFVAEAKLTGEAGPTGETAVSGQPNLYRWEEGASLRFVARLEGGSLGGGQGAEGDTRDWSPAAMSPTQESLTRTARVSADGGSVVFSSVRALTGSPNRAPSCSASGCAEFFRYAASTGTLDCVSCDPTGARPIGAATIGTGYIEASDFPEYKAAPVLSRNLSASGNRFFFQTPDPLVSADHNSSGCSFGAINPSQEQASCMDVYEWEAPASGTCTSALTDGGCLYLISSGDSDQPSYFADADREGENVYFFTSSPLVPADGDQLYDVYDAREHGGLASQHTRPAPPCESRQGCQGPQTGAEVRSTPGTSSFVGRGNPHQKNCSQPAKRATSLSRRAKKLRRNAKKARSAEKAKQIRRKAHNLASRAKQKSRQAKVCRKGESSGKKRGASPISKRRAGHDRGGRK